MTTSRREQILSAVATALATTAGVGGRVYRSSVEAFSRDEAPAMVIEAGPDRADLQHLQARLDPGCAGIAQKLEMPAL